MGWVRHEDSDGSRDHVIRYTQQGNWCNNKDCEISEPRNRLRDDAPAPQPPLALMRDAFMRWCQHDEDCLHVTISSPCDCGFRQVWEAVRTNDYEALAARLEARR